MECGLLRDERLDVLYGEADAATRQRVEAHLAVCESCRAETADLVALRRDLRSWSLPAGTAGGVKVGAVPRRLSRWLPLAAGFVLGLGGAALGLSGSEVRYEAGQLSVRLGRPAPDYRQAVAEQESRALTQVKELRAEIAALRGPSASVGSTSRDVLSQVAELIRESETRQAQQIQASLAGLDQRREAQRRYDMARVAASLAYLDGRNGQHVARTTELMGYMLEASHNKR